MRLKDTQTIR